LAEDVTDRFNALDINGFDAEGLSFLARQKLIVRLNDFMRVYETTADLVSSEYELQFNRILAGRIEAEYPAPGPFIHCKAHRESDLLSETLRHREHLTYGEAFAHFELTCEYGKLDVIARDFFLTAVDKGTVERGGGGDGGAAASGEPEGRGSE